MKIFFLHFFVFFMCVMPALGKEITASYVAEGLNMQLLTAQMQINLNENDYKINTKALARGLLSMFIHAETIFETTGQINQNTLRVNESIMKMKDNKKISRIPQNFSNKPDYLDYQSLLLHLMRLDTPQTHDMLVSDGKRDMRITLIYEGNANLASVYSGLTGEAQKWGVRINILSGNKKGWFFKRVQEEKSPPLTLYLKTDKSGDKSLVLGVFDTGVLGKLFIIKKEEINE